MKKRYIFNFKLREILERKGMSQRELALKAGLREATVSELVNGTRQSINKKHIVKVMEALNIDDINELIEVIVLKEK